MTFITLFIILACLVVFFGFFFAYSTAQEENKSFDFIEFIKIFALFILCGILFGVFLDIFFLVTRAFLWVLAHAMEFFRQQIFSRETSTILSLLAINAMGGYLFWEMLKEKKEREEADFQLSETEPADAKDEAVKEESNNAPVSATQSEEPLKQDEPVVQEELLTQEEPIIEEESVVQEEPIIEEEPEKKEEPVTQGEQKKEAAEEAKETKEEGTKDEA